MQNLIAFVVVPLGIGLAACSSDVNGGRTGGTDAAGASGAAGTSGSAGRAAGGFDTEPSTPDEPGATRIATNARLIDVSLSLHGKSCSRGSSPGDRWCGLARPGMRAPGELWVVNVSAIARGESVRCDQSTPTCLKLADGIFGEMAHFHGDMLFFTDESLSSIDRSGVQYIWRAGWTKPRALTRAARSYCWVQYPGGSMACWEDVASGTSTQTLIRQGALGSENDGLLPEIGILAPVQGVEGAGRSGGGNYMIHDGTVTDGSGLFVTAGTFQIAPMNDPSHPRLVAEEAYFPETTSDDAAAFYLGITGNTFALYSKTLPDGASRKLVDGVPLCRMLPLPPMPGTQPGVLAFTYVAPNTLARDGGTIEWIQSNGERHEVGYGDLPYPDNVSPELKAVLLSSYSRGTLQASSLDGKQTCLLADKEARRATFLPGTRVILWQDSNSYLFAAVFEGQCPRKQLDYAFSDWVVAPGQGLVYADSYQVKWIALTDQNLASAKPITLALDIDQFDYEAISRVLLYVSGESSKSSAVYAMINKY